MKYLQNNDCPVVYEAIDKPAAELHDKMDPLAAGLAHEQYVTSLIHTIYEAAYEVRDFRTMQFLDWFVKEQGEEETNASDLVKKMELFGGDSKGLRLIGQPLWVYRRSLPRRQGHPPWRFSTISAPLPLWPYAAGRGLFLAAGADHSPKSE